MLEVPLPRFIVHACDPFISICTKKENLIFFSIFPYFILIHTEWICSMRFFKIWKYVNKVVFISSNEKKFRIHRTWMRRIFFFLQFLFMISARKCITEHWGKKLQCVKDWSSVCWMKIYNEKFNFCLESIFMNQYFEVTLHIYKIGRF